VYLVCPDLLSINAAVVFPLKPELEICKSVSGFRTYNPFSIQLKK
jgi:hypothetical protein